MCLGKDLQTLFLSVDPEMAHESALAPLGSTSETSGGKPTKLRLYILKGFCNLAPACPSHTLQIVFLEQGPCRRHSYLHPQRPEGTLYAAPPPSQSQSASKPEDPGSQQKTLLSASPEILKGPYIGLQCLPTREILQEILLAIPMDILKCPVLSSIHITAIVYH